MTDAAERQATETPLIPELPGRDRSLWIDTAKSVEYPPLAGNIETDVAILGGGIAGITAAHALHKAGLRVTVVESRRILRGVTGNTTAKLTAAHGLIYAHLVDHFGPEKARLYALANQRAIDHVERMIGELNIPERAHFRRMPAYTFLRDTKRTDEIHAEAEATARCGLTAAFVDSFDLFFPIAGAVRVDDQAVFHPLLYLQALADNIAGSEAASSGFSNGSRIYENTRALEVKSPKKDSDPVEVLTDRGAIRANAVIVATHQPFMYEGAYFARVSPKRSYVIHLRFPEPLPDHLANAHYYGPETPYLSLRPTADGQGLLVGGQNHKTGEGKRMHEHYQNLEKQARELFGDKPTVEHRWSTQDGVSIDRVPFIGPLTPGSDRVFVATGFGGWGMSNGVVAGIVLSELVQGRTHEWAEVFDPSRIKPETSAGEFLKHNLGAAKHLVGDHLKNLTKPDLIDLYPGQARVMGVGTEKLAVYRDPAGKVHVCSAICTHLGCAVNWNSAERSWDCPCHGSRFTPEGEVLQGPAVKDLKKGKIEYD